MTPEEIKIDELEEALAAVTELFRRAKEHSFSLDARIAELHARSDADAAEIQRLKTLLHDLLMSYCPNFDVEDVRRIEECLK